jgi:hypothetical protein
MLRRTYRTSSKAVDARSSPVLDSLRLSKPAITKFKNHRCVVDVTGRIWPSADAKQHNVDGVACDSVGEAKRYLVLLDRQRRGLLRDLRHPHVLSLHVHGVKLGELRADFSYVDTSSGKLVVEDFKGRHDKSRDVEYRFFRWKCAHVAAEHGITVVEVHDEDNSARAQWARRLDAQRKGSR